MAIFLVYVLAWSMHGPGRIIERNVGLRVREAVADALYAKLASLPLGWHEAHHSADMQQRAQQASSALADFTQSQFLYLQNFVNVIGPLVALSLMSAWTGALAFAGYIAVAYVIIRFDRALHEFIDRLQYDPAVIARAEQIKNDTLNDDAVRRFSLSLWSDAKEALLRYAEKTATPGEPGSPGALERGLTSIGEALLADAHLLARADDAIVDAALAVIEKHQDEVGALISSTVAAWDPEVTSKRIELAIGRDLQFIRINGTVVGGLVGLGLYTISWLMR